LCFAKIAHAQYKQKTQAPNIDPLTIPPATMLRTW